MKFHQIVIFLLSITLLLNIVSSTHTNTKKFQTEVLDPNYAHFAESLYNPNYTPEGILALLN